MEPVLRLMHMRGVVRQALKLVKGVNIKLSDSAMTIEVFSVIGWLKVVETYKLNGEPSVCRRRDLRRGQHTGCFQALPPVAYPSSKAKSEEGKTQQCCRFSTDLTWGEPFGGRGLDVYELIAPDVLHVKSVITVGDQEMVTNGVFRKK